MMVHISIAPRGSILLVVCRELNDFQKRLCATIQRKSTESRNPVSIGLLLTYVLTCVCVCFQHNHEVVAV